MTTTAKPSKNKLRKSRRRAYYDAVNALAGNPRDVAAADALEALKERYFVEVDGRIDGLGLFSDADQAEWAFMNDILRVVEENGWVVLYTKDMGEIQIKSDVFEYIKARRTVRATGKRASCAAQRAAAAQHLCERAVASIRPRHP